jgi:chemotaxis protein MotB
MKNRRRLLSEDDSLQHVWPAFTDITSSIALILFVLILLAYVRNLVSSQELRAYRDQIASSEKRLSLLSGELAQTTREIASGRARLAASELELAQQQAVIGASARELDSLKGRLSSIALLRVDVLNKVKSSIEAVLGGSQAAESLVRIGDNGNIVINEGLVFEFNSFAIKPGGTHLLDTLARALQGVLGDPNVSEYVDAIVVQGHTDDRGSGSFNRDLSAKRANAVLDYLFQANPVLETTYGKYFASSAYSEFRPLDPGTNEAAYERNRRIEISVILKDATIPRLIEQYMQSVQAAPAAPAAAPARPAPAP